MLNRAERGAAKPSLRVRLARHVLLPLALTWGLGSVAVLMVGKHFAAQAFDRSLLDDAYALAAHVLSVDGRLSLDLTPQAIGTLLFDQSETLYYAVYGPDGGFLTGHAELTPTTLPPGTTYDFAERAFAGGPVRSVSLRRDGPAGFTVVMAQTTAGRTALLRQLLVVSGLVQALLLLVLAGWLSRTIQRDLQPLSDLQQAMNRRDASDLAPLPAALTVDATTRDVQHLGESLNSLLARLQRSLDAQREFVGNAAHELRTPLAGIRAQAGLALAQHDPAVWRSELQGIAIAEQRASRLVDQLLALARADEGSVGQRLETLALDEVVRGLVLRWLPKADTLGVDLGAEGLDDRVLIRGDPALIEGLMNNLLDNALRYGHNAAPRVTVALRRAAPWAVLTVSDNGPGLGGVEPARLMQRWTQGASGRTLGQGAGLGLAIVGRYAELLGAGLAFLPADGGSGLCVELRFRLETAAG